MASPSVTYTFTNGTTADAAQVNQNLTDILNGLTDGTRDLTINALSMNGALSVSGGATLGDSSADDVSILGSLAASIVIKTTNTYDIGTSALSIRSIYLSDSAGNARAVRVKAGVTPSSYTMTLPTSAGTTGMGVNTDGSGTLSFRYPDKVLASQTTTYAATGDEVVIPCDATSAGFTVGLPAAASYTGKRYTIVKTDSTFNVVTVDGNASETINGATTTTLNTQYEAVTIVSDGTNWLIANRRIPGLTTAYTLVIGGSSGAPTQGAGATKAATWRRMGDCIEINFFYKQTAGGSSGTGDYTFPLPTGLTIDTAKQPVTADGVNVVGFGWVSNAANGKDASTIPAKIVPYTSSALAILAQTDVSSNIQDASNWIGQSGSFFPLNGTIVLYCFRAIVPISGWAS